MTRVLVTYANTGERRLAARRASRLAARGVDVDIASSAAAETLPSGWYDRVLDATAIEPLPAAEGGEGVVRIVSGTMGRALIPTAPAATPLAPATRGHVLASLVVAIVAALVLGLLGLPIVYAAGAGVLVGLAASAMLRGHEPAPAAAFAAPGSSALPSGHALHIA